MAYRDLHAAHQVLFPVAVFVAAVLSLLGMEEHGVRFWRYDTLAVVALSYIAWCAYLMKKSDAAMEAPRAPVEPAVAPQAVPQVTVPLARREVKPSAPVSSSSAGPRAKPAASVAVVDLAKADTYPDACINCGNRNICYETMRSLIKDWDYHCKDYQRDDSLSRGRVVDLGGDE